MSSSTDTRTVSGAVEPGIHEFGANLTFADDHDGLSPFFAIAVQFDEALGNESTFEAAGDVWKLNHEEEKVKAWEGKIAGREEDSFDAFREYQFGLVAATDEVGRKRVNLQFRPALLNARHAETGERIKSLPADLPEGVRVNIQSANVEPEATLEVLRGLAELIDVNPSYFEDSKIHQGRVFNLAVYARIRRDFSEDRIVGMNGLLERLAVFCPRRPGQGEYVWDNEQLMGHRNAVGLNPTGLRKLYPAHAVGKLLKSYHMKHPRKSVPEGEEPDDPTYHPKLEVQFSQKYSPSEHQSVRWNPAAGDGGIFGYEMLRDRLERHLLHALEWADISLDPDDPAYVPDEYWTPRPREEPIEIHPDPTDHLVEAERELATNHFVNADLTEAQRTVTRVLANGGMKRVDEVADEADVHPSTVYRVAQRLDSIIQLMDGTISFEDDVIRSKVQSLFSILDRDFDYIANSVRKLVRDGEELLLEDTTLGRWARRYAAEVLDDEEMEIQIKLGEWSEIEIWRIVKAGLRAAGQVGSRTQANFEQTTIRWTDQEGTERSSTLMRGYGGEVRFLGGNLRSPHFAKQASALAAR